MQRGLSDCLRVAMGWAAEESGLPAAGLEAGAGPASAPPLDAVWNLLAELYERPLEAPAAAAAASSSSTAPGCAAVPRGFSDADNWQLLLWAALLCAQDWHQAQITGSVEAASRYQETVLRVRRLVPFVELLPEGAGRRWSFLSERHGAGEAARGAAARGNGERPEQRELHGEIDEGRDASPPSSRASGSDTDESEAEEGESNQPAAEETMEGILLRAIEKAKREQAVASATVTEIIHLRHHQTVPRCALSAPSSAPTQHPTLYHTLRSLCRRPWSTRWRSMRRTMRLRS